MEQKTRDKGKCNILCNGPLRRYYKDNGLFTVGCNFPPVPVDLVCIIDREPMRKWIRDNEIPLSKNQHYVFNHAALEEFKTVGKKYFAQHKIHIDGIFRNIRSYFSSGHWATFAAVKMGYTEFDIYGVDSFWTTDISSYTDEFVEKGKPLDNPKFAGEWRKSWHRLAQEEGKRCIFNFIKEVKEDGTVIKETIHYQ